MAGCFPGLVTGLSLLPSPSMGSAVTVTRIGPPHARGPSKAQAPEYRWAQRKITLSETVGATLPSAPLCTHNCQQPPHPGGCPARFLTLLQHVAENNTSVPPFWPGGRKSARGPWADGPCRWSYFLVTHPFASGLFPLPSSSSLKTCDHTGPEGFSSSFKVT